MAKRPAEKVKSANVVAQAYRTQSGGLRGVELLDPNGLRASRFLSLEEIRQANAVLGIAKRNDDEDSDPDGGPEPGGAA